MASNIFLFALSIPPASILVKAETSVAIDTRAKRLLSEIEERKRYPIDHPNWKAASGPWASYLAREFKDGLSPKEQVLYLTALKNGDCYTVRSLLVAGFLLQYPFLESAHSRIAVGEIFESTVAKKTSAYEYCMARRGLNEAFRVIAARKLNIAFPFRADLFAQGIAHKLTPETMEDRVRNTLCYVISNLSALAVQDDYIPALRDLVAPVRGRSIAVLPVPLEYYFLRRAEHLKLSNASSDLRLDSLYHKVKSRMRLKIERYARDRKGPAPFSVLWRCPFPRI